MTDLTITEDHIYSLLARAERDELICSEREIKKDIVQYITLMEEMCVTLQDLLNAISYTGFKSLEVLIPLPKDMRAIVMSYDEENVFNSNNKYFNYFMDRSYYMERFINYISQMPTIRNCIVNHVRARCIINNIATEMESKKHEIIDLLPFLTIRINEEYKK